MQQYPFWAPHRKYNAIFSFSFLPKYTYGLFNDRFLREIYSEAENESLCCPRNNSSPWWSSTGEGGNWQIWRRANNKTPVTSGLFADLVTQISYKHPSADFA